MKTWAKVAIPLAVMLAAIAWYAFRPERLVVNRRVDEAMPTTQGGSSAQAVEAGQFYSILHPTEGTATIYQMSDGTRILRFTSFSTSNGPDVHVYMVASDDAKDAAAVEKAGFVDLGVIKGNIGDQNYTLGNDLDLAKYSRFHWFEYSCNDTSYRMQASDGQNGSIGFYGLEQQDSGQFLVVRCSNRDMYFLELAKNQG